jgi:predicted nucleic-acid-binding protein
MIAVDTNVLARAILNDDTIQSRIAKQLLSNLGASDSLYVSPFVVMELAWLLRSKGFKRTEIVPVLQQILESDGVEFGKKNILIAALDLYRKNNISFSDCLIAADGHLSANAKTATFDDDLRKSVSFCLRPNDVLKSKSSKRA